MPARRPHRRFPGAGTVPRIAVWSLPPALGGCTAGDGNGVFASVALVAVGLAGYALGSLRERRSAEAALRAARAERRDAVALLDGWAWQSDAAHRLLSVQPPAETPPDGARPLAAGAVWDQFETAQPGVDGGLRGRLGTQRAFAALRVRLTLTGTHGARPAVTNLRVVVL